MSATDYLENALLDHVLGTVEFTMPTQLYLALFTAAPGEAGGGTEVAGSGYGREAIDFAAAAAGVAANSALITFTASGGDWGTVSSWALFDAETSGNMLFYGSLSISRTVLDGDSLTVAIGAITVTMD